MISLLKENDKRLKITLLVNRNFCIQPSEITRKKKNTSQIIEFTYQNPIFTSYLILNSL